jgi:hypothetical protein
LAREKQRDGIHWSGFHPLRSETPNLLKQLGKKPLGAQVSPDDRQLIAPRYYCCNPLPDMLTSTRQYKIALQSDMKTGGLHGIRDKRSRLTSGRAYSIGSVLWSQSLQQPGEAGSSSRGPGGFYRSLDTLAEIQEGKTSRGVLRCVRLDYSHVLYCEEFPLPVAGLTV